MSCNNLCIRLLHFVLRCMIQMWFLQYCITNYGHKITTKMNEHPLDSLNKTEYNKLHKGCIYCRAMVLFCIILHRYYRGYCAHSLLLEHQPLNIHCYVGWEQLPDTFVRMQKATLIDGITAVLQICLYWSFTLVSNQTLNKIIIIYIWWLWVGWKQVTHRFMLAQTVGCTEGALRCFLWRAEIHVSNLEAIE